MAGSRLFIKCKKGKVQCDKCGYDGMVKLKDNSIFHVSFPTLTCPECGSPTKIIEGRECLIKRVKLVI